MNRHIKATAAVFILAIIVVGVISNILWIKLGAIAGITLIVPLGIATGIAVGYITDRYIK